MKIIAPRFVAGFFFTVSLVSTGVKAENTNADVKNLGVIISPHIDMAHDAPLVVEHLKKFRQQNRDNKQGSQRMISTKPDNKRRTRKQSEKPVKETIKLEVSTVSPPVVNRTDYFQFQDITERTQAGAISGAELASRRQIIEQLRQRNR